MAGLDAFGTELRRGNDAGSVFTAIANVSTVGGPGLSRETIDVTAHDSPEQWMEFLGGLKDGGEVSLDVNYNPGEVTHAFLQDDFDDTDPRAYKLVFPDDDQTTWTFRGILAKFETDAPYDDKLSASLTFKVSGKPTLAPLGS